MDQLTKTRSPRRPAFRPANPEALNAWKVKKPTQRKPKAPEAITPEAAAQVVASTLPLPPAPPEAGGPGRYGYPWKSAFNRFRRGVKLRPATYPSNGTPWQALALAAEI